MSLAGQPPVSSDDYSSIVIIMSWLVGVTVSLCVAVKIIMKLQMVRNFVVDDAAIVVSLVSRCTEDATRLTE